MSKFVMMPALVAALLLSPTVLAATNDVLPAGSAPVAATPEGFTSRADVIAACAVEGATKTGCQAVLAAYVAYLGKLGLTPAQVDAALSDLVVALGTAASGLPPDVFAVIKEVVADAIATVASSVSDPTLAASLAEIGQTVADATSPGDLGDLGSIGEDPASPS
ncbi:hypothetical protein [Devosia sp.]|uniref:hypothetical protein n=1 Tax=Devosia sp. TaxID=1871048 RepID=UPI003BABE796